MSFLPWLMRGAFDIVQPDATGLGATLDPDKVVRYSPQAKRLFEG